MLAFRVGVVDETLPIRGVTHVVEHLAMYGPMQNAEMANRMNARVELHRTRFFADGTESEIAAFLAEVTSNLAALPLDRLDNEKKILRTEGVNKPIGSTKRIWTFRFGARGLGLADYEEFGLRSLSPDRVAGWAAANFTSGNAALWLSGPPPEGLRLNLPQGPRRTVPSVVPLDFPTPAIYPQGDRWVVMSMLGARGVPLAIGAQVLDARVRDSVRIQQSLAYEVRAGYQRADNTTAEVTAFADSLIQNSRAAAEALVAVTRTLAQEGPTTAELANAVADRRRMAQGPDAELGRLDQRVIEELEGLEPKTNADLDAEMDALTPDSVAQALRSAFKTSCIGVPNDVVSSIDGFTPIPTGNGVRFTGTQVTASLGAEHEDVIDYSEEGISLTSPDQTTTGMKWQDVAVGMSWNDGERTLIGLDGLGFRIVPERWKNPEPLIKQILASVPGDLWVPMDDPDGAQEKATKPAKPEWMRQASLRRWMLALLIIVDVLFGIFALTGLVGVTGGENDTFSVILFVYFAVVLALAIIGTIAVVVRARWVREVSIIVALGVSVTVVGLVLGVPIWIVASKLPARSPKAPSPT